MAGRPRTRTLALDPGTRFMGVAVFELEDLLYHGVVTLRGASDAERLKEGAAAVERMVRDFRPGLLALEETFVTGTRNAALLRLLISEIRLVAGRQGIRAVGLAPATVKKAVTGDGRAGKGQVARVGIERYPELSPYLLVRDSKWKRRFHSNMFDAVAVGMTMLQRRS